MKWRSAISAASVLAVQIGVFVLVVVLWQLAAGAHVINGQLFGTPDGILAAAVRDLKSGSLPTDAGVTVYETLVGFVAGTLIGSAAGLLLWFSRFAARVIEPVVVAFNGMPKIALGPLIIIWLGAGLMSKMVLAFVSTVTVAFIAAYAAAHEVDRDLITLLRSFGASRLQIFRKLLVPASMPLIFGAMRINVGFAIGGAIVGEFISSSAGLGHSIFVAGNLFDLNTVWLGVIVLSLIAAAMYAALALCERAIVKGRS